jgi:hypothetical protein
MIVNDELGSLSKEAFMACFNILPQNFTGGTEENHRNLSHDGLLLGQELDLRLTLDKTGLQASGLLTFTLRKWHHGGWIVLFQAGTQW